MWERPSCQWCLSSRKLPLRFLAEAANSTEREVAANSNTVCFHTQEQTVCMVKPSKGWSSCGGRKDGNRSIRAIVNCFSFPYQQVSIPENTAAFSRVPPSSPSRTCCNSKPPFAKSTSQVIFQKKKRKISPRKMKLILLRWDSKVQRDPGLHGVNEKFTDISETGNRFLYKQAMQRKIHCRLVNQRHKALPKQTALLRGFYCSKDPPSCLCSPHGRMSLRVLHRSQEF